MYTRVMHDITYTPLTFIHPDVTSFVRYISFLVNELLPC